MKHGTLLSQTDSSSSSVPKTDPSALHSSGRFPLAVSCLQPNSDVLHPSSDGLPPLHACHKGRMFICSPKPMEAETVMGFSLERSNSCETPNADRGEHEKSRAQTEAAVQCFLTLIGFFKWCSSEHGQGSAFFGHAAVCVCIQLCFQEYVI